MAIEHVFACRECHEEAGRLILYAPAEAIPGVQGDALYSLSVEFANRQIESPRLTMSSPWFGTSYSKFNLSQVMNAVSSGDARTLHSIDEEMVPFWCPTCSASYCAKHWKTWVVFDEVFFDEMRGTCLKGHERRIAD
jgi:hypothetical protein